MLYSFCATIHAMPADASPGPGVALSGGTFQALQIAPVVLARSEFACDFETALDRLALLERMYCEPDGSFVWASPQGMPAWQVDGNLYDRQERLSYVELAGRCPPPQFDQLLAALGWPQTALVFQLRREAVVLDECEFRRYAATAG
jgi:hypothetical protein